MGIVRSDFFFRLFGNVTFFVLFDALETNKTRSWMVMGKMALT